MKKPNLHWPVWFPYPTSWLKALTLTMFLRVMIFVVEKTGKVSYSIINFTKSIELFVIFSILIILSPILLIAFTHHFFHLFISYLIPKIPAPEIGKKLGLFPGLISWWEGLYGWLVIILSWLISVFLCTFFLPIFNISYNDPVIYYTKYQINIIVLLGTFYISIGSVLYHIEYLVKRRYISVYSVKKEEVTNKNNIVSEVEAELNKLRIEMNINPELEPEINHLKKRNYWNFKQKKLVLLLITPIITILYLIINLPNIQNKIIFSVSSNNQLPTLSTSPIPTPTQVNSALPRIASQSDNFREAVNKASSAANLTQSAKSQADWQTIVREWEGAISMMQSVPLSNPNYAVAQQKIIEYQRNLSYAQKNATNTK